MLNSLKKLLLTLSFFLGIQLAGTSQTLTNVDFQKRENTLVVTYDLKDCPQNESYDVKLLIHVVNDDYILEPGKLTGDVKNVPCGTGKSISWIPLEDISELVGPIQVEVKITVYHVKPKTAAPEKKSKSKIASFTGRDN